MALEPQQPHGRALAGNRGRSCWQTYLDRHARRSGIVPVRECGFHVALHALDEMPECPNCGEQRFARASMFDVAEPDHASLHDDEDAAGWTPSATASRSRATPGLPGRRARVGAAADCSEWTRIGRSLTADIRLDDPTVSRRHALVCRQDERVRVLDDRSLNGIFLNGERVEWHDLADGDELIVGRYRLLLPRHARVAATPARPTRPQIGSAVRRRRRTSRTTRSGRAADATRSKPTGRSARARGTDIRKCARGVGGDAADALAPPRAARSARARCA